MIHEDGISRREERRRNRRDELLTAALELVSEQGLEGLSVQALAKRTDRSVGAMYRYFSSLEAVLVALQCRILEELGSYISEAAGDSQVVGASEALLRVMRIASAYRDFGLQRPHHFGLLSSILANPRFLLSAEEAGVVGASMEGLLAVVEQALEEAEQQSGLSEGCARERCLLLWVSTQGLLQLRKLGRLEPRLAEMDDLLDALLRTLLLGWGADPLELNSAFRQRDEVVV